MWLSCSFLLHSSQFSIIFTAVHAVSKISLALCCWFWCQQLQNTCPQYPCLRSYLQFLCKHVLIPYTSKHEMSSWSDSSWTFVSLYNKAWNLCLSRKEELVMGWDRLRLLVPGLENETGWKKLPALKAGGRVHTCACVLRVCGWGVYIFVLVCGFCSDPKRSLADSHLPLFLNCNLISKNNC